MKLFREIIQVPSPFFYQIPCRCPYFVPVFKCCHLRGTPVCFETARGSAKRTSTVSFAACSLQILACSDFSAISHSISTPFRPRKLTRTERPEFEGHDLFLDAFVMWLLWPLPIQMPFDSVNSYKPCVQSLYRGLFLRIFCGQFPVQVPTHQFRALTQTLRLAWGATFF